MKQWFPVAHTNSNRANAGSVEGIAGRAYPVLVANRLRTDVKFRSKVCSLIGHRVNDLKEVVVGRLLNAKVESVIDGLKTTSKVSLRFAWKNGTHTNFIVKKAGPAHICLKKIEKFVPEFEAQFKKKIPHDVREALLLFVGGHPRQKQILDSISVNFVGDEIRDLERSYRNRLTLASMYGYDDTLADRLMNWFRENSSELTAFCFSRGAAKRVEDYAEYLWYHSSNNVDSDIDIVDLKLLIQKLKLLPQKVIAPMVCPRDSARVGSTINLPFGNLQYHEEGIEFRHDRDKIHQIMQLKVEPKKQRFGSSAKTSGHENELLIAASLNADKEFRTHFCGRIGRDENEFVSAEAGGKNAKQEISVLGGKTAGKTDVSVLWKDGSHTNISVKKRASGQVYLVTARNFVAAYEAQYNVIVPSRVCRALAFFIGEDPESQSILEATDISIDGSKYRKQAYEQNCRLMFSVIKNYDPNMATELISFIHDKLDNVFELCFAAGAVKDRSLWSNVLWYKNLVDEEGMGLDYLVSIPVVKAAIQRQLPQLTVEPGKHPGSTIQLPFGHLQYFHKQLEFYQKLKKIQSLLIAE